MECNYINRGVHRVRVGGWATFRVRVRVGFGLVRVC